MHDDRKTLGRYGKGSLELQGDIVVLHVKGAAYERGYQHGHLLRDRIDRTASRGLTGAAAVCALAIGGTLEDGFERLRRGREEAAGYVPPEFREELRGMADALAAAGSPLDFDDLLLWNTMYDSWCFFAHPDPSDPAATYPREPYTIGCSSFSAWGTRRATGASSSARTWTTSTCRASSRGAS